MAYYFNPLNVGIISSDSLADGYSIQIKWNRAYPTNKTFKIAYNIYYSEIELNVFNEGVKFVSIDDSLVTQIDGLVPGQLYHFAVRAFEYDSNLINLNNLPNAFNNLKYYPESLLSSNISETSINIPLVDNSEFPPSGIVKIGVELINYSSKSSNNLVLTSLGLQRGFYNTDVSIHNTDGYDGYEYWDPFVKFWSGKEELNLKIFACQNRFDVFQYQFTEIDGYHQVISDLLTTDLTISDENNKDFPTYDYAIPHNTNINDLLSGKCVGSYIGGEMFCVDSYSGVGRTVRGISLQEQNNQRQEMLLNTTGEAMCLIKHVWTGITCHCYLPTSEYGDDRCPNCLGQKFVIGWEQFYNPRRSDGKILVRVGPYSDDVKTLDAGFESNATLDCWTLTYPTIKNRDILIRFDEGGNEEFRYEVLDVTRNKIIMGLQGAQKFRMQRIRKTDPLYKIRFFKDSSTLPSKLSTNLSNNIPGMPPHAHEIVISEKITNINQINQITSVVNGHNHLIINGVVQPVLGHTHSIILP